jgi:hypothetical protein
MRPVIKINSFGLSDHNDKPKKVVVVKRKKTDADFMMEGRADSVPID